MTKEKLDLLLAGSFEDLVKAIAVKPKPKPSKAGESIPLDEYNVDEHPVFDKNEGKRPDVWVKNDKGENVRERKVNRIGLALEQLITSEAAAFLCANPIIYKATPANEAEEKMLAALNRVNEACKLDYKNMNILERRMSELQVAEIYYLEDIEEDDDYWAGTGISAKQKIRVFIASPSLGDELYPVWSGQENLIALGRHYKVTEDEKEIEHFDLYTADKIYEGVKGEGSGWTMVEQDNSIKKVTVIYHEQKLSEWHLVRSLIRRLEDILSNLADSNDKTMSPLLFVEGDLKTLPDSFTGRVFKGTQGTKLGYVTADNAPEATKLEIGELLRQIFLLTFTPEISLDSLKGIGQTSGVAMDFMFLGAHLKASKHMGTFGECLQRRSNLHKKMLTVIDSSLQAGITLQRSPSFDLFLPKDIAGIINYLTAAIGGDKPIISQETATGILQGAMGGDGKEEFERIENESTKEEESPGGLDKLMNDAPVIKINKAN